MKTVLLIGAVAWLVAVSQLQGHRTVDGRVLRSTMDPVLRIEVDAALTYIGSLEIPIRDAARAERYVFVDAASGTLRRLFVAQFESFNADAPGTYELTISRPAMLDKSTYQLDTGFYSFREASASKPGAEADQTRKMLASRGFGLDDDLLVARFSRTTDVARRSEVILFYWESLKALGYNRGDLQQGGRAAGQREAVMKAFIDRARAAIKVTDVL
jgi:phytoene/squalene synthetase